MLNASQITLPANDRDVMAREACLRALKKWRAIADTAMNEAGKHWASRTALTHEAHLAEIEARIQTRQEGRAA